MKNVGSGAAAGILPVSGAFAVCADEAAVRPPQGSALLLELVAEGVQIYACGGCPIMGIPIAIVLSYRNCVGL
jgi:hypothetical protein